MTIRECYEQINGDYEDVLRRLMDDHRIQKILHYFQEENLLEELEAFIDEKDYTEAFRISHSIKGVCLNLGFTRLQESSSELCEALKDGKKPENLEKLFEAVKKDYRNIIEVIEKL